MKKMIWKMGKIIIGTLFMAMAVNFVYEPMNMVTGGVSGLAISIKALSARFFTWNIPVWVTNLVLNLPIFLGAYFVKGRKFFWYTFFANICFSFFLFILPVLPIEQRDFFLASIVGGVLTGGGLGLVFATGYSTGGTDLLSSIIQKYLNGYSVASILFILDAFVIATGVIVFGVYTSVYAVLAVFLSSKIMDGILSGLKVGKQMWIISDAYEQIGKEIMQEMERGVTCFHGTGMYSENEKRVLLCVVGKREIVSVVKIVRRNDASAFLIVQDAREVMGEGFEEIS